MRDTQDVLRDARRLIDGSSRKIALKALQEFDAASTDKEKATVAYRYFQQLTKPPRALFVELQEVTGLP